jgi:hypothetical protein
VPRPARRTATTRVRLRVFRVHSYPGGWIYRDVDGSRRIGIGVRIGRWTYFLVWRRGPYWL